MSDSLEQGRKNEQELPEVPPQNAEHAVSVERIAERVEERVVSKILDALSVGSEPERQ